MVETFNEMQSLTLKGKKYDSFRDQTARQQLEELKNNGSDSTQNGNGLTTAEKNTMLTLFKNVPYSTDMSATISELVALWTVNHGVAYNLTNATSSNAASAITEGDAYKTTLTADNLFTLSGAVVEVTMGGVDITEEAYSNGVISIASVTGDVVITVAAAEMAIADTTAMVETTGCGINRLGATVAAANVGVTKDYDCPGTADTIYAHIRIGEDVTFAENYCRAVGFDSGGAVINYSSEAAQRSVYLTNEADPVAFLGISENHATVKIAVGVNHLDYSYAYYQNTGAVIFAGKNTPYYGMANIDGTMVEV